jgi:TRAP transporter TAXI family solute receptor
MNPAYADMKITFTLLSALLLAACGGSERRNFISIGTGSQTGVYYPVGGAIKQLVEEAHGKPLHVSTKASLGSVQNINDVMNGSVTFGIAQSDRQFQAYHGLSNWENDPQTDLRFVFSLHPEVVTLIAADDSGIRQITDLREKRVNIGSPGSGHRGNALDILGTAGIDPDSDLQAESLTVGECAGMLQDNRIDAYFYTVGHPNGSITEASTGRRKVRFIPITGMEALLEESPFYSVARVPVHLYPQAVQDEEVQSLGMLTTLVTRADTPDETVYTLVKAVFENLDRLKAQHPALHGLSPETMLQGGNAPLHPGAEQYYRETGLLK